MAECEVRPFTQEFVELAVQMGRAFHEESPVYNKLAFNDIKTRTWMHTFASPTGKSNRRGWVALCGDEFVGGLLAYTAPSPWSNGLLSFDAITYLAPSYRGFGIGKMLADAYVDWANDEGVDLIMLASSCGIAPERTMDFYMRSNFAPVGAQALYVG